MGITKVFRSGNSQAVRIPKEFHINSREVEIYRRGREIVLREREPDLSEAFKALTELSDDFFRGGRKQPKQRKRESF